MSSILPQIVRQTSGSIGRNPTDTHGNARETDDLACAKGIGISAILGLTFWVPLFLGIEWL